MTPVVLWSDMHALRLTRYLETQASKTLLGILFWGCPLVLKMSLYQGDVNVHPIITIDRQGIMSGAGGV